MDLVSNAAKILARMRSNPRDWRIDDLKIVADRFGFDYDQGGTSHAVFRHPKVGRLSVPVRRPVKPVYVRLFLELIDKLGGQNED